MPVARSTSSPATVDIQDGLLILVSFPKDYVAHMAGLHEVLLATFPNLTVVAGDREVVRKAARLRARYNVRPVDALQVAAAVVKAAARAAR